MLTPNFACGKEITLDKLSPGLSFNLGELIQPTEKNLSKMANFMWSLINLAALWFVGWPLAFFCSWIYILLSPFSACIEGKRDLGIL